MDPSSQRFGQIAFSKFGGKHKGGQQQHHYPSVLILNPFRVPPGPIRVEWFHRYAEQQQQQLPSSSSSSSSTMPLIVYWLGAMTCGHKRVVDSAFSFCSSSQLIDYEQGVARGYNRVDEALLGKYHRKKHQNQHQNKKRGASSACCSFFTVVDWRICVDYGNWNSDGVGWKILKKIIQMILIIIWNVSTKGIRTTKPRPRHLTLSSTTSSSSLCQWRKLKEMSTLIARKHPARGRIRNHLRVSDVAFKRTSFWNHHQMCLPQKVQKYQINVEDIGPAYTIRFGYWEGKGPRVVELNRMGQGYER